MPGARATGHRGTRVIVVGDLVTDVLVVPVGDLVIGSDTRAAIRIAGGGQAANTAAWLARLGRPVTLVTSVGGDDAGRDRLAELTAAGVDCAVSVHSGTPTGSVVVLSTPHERTMITDSGATLLLDAAQVSAAVADAPDPGHLHLSGYPLLHAGPRPAAMAALAAARRRGCTTSVDAASAAPLRQVGASAFLDWVRGTDLLLANADEARELAGAGTAARQAALLTRVARHVVVKRGADGSVWCTAGGPTVEVGADVVPAVDPTGAGDAFAAGLLDAWCAGAAPGAALTAGSALGAEAVRRVGARPA